MCGRGNVMVPIQPSLRVILVLLACFISLATHFVVEGFSPVLHGPNCETAVHHGHIHPQHEHSEDHFTVIRPIALSPESHFTFLFNLAATGALAYSVSPLLPPPNL